MLEDFRRKRILPFGNIAEFLQQRQVAIGLYVAHRAGIAVPVPGAAEIATGFHDPQALESRLAEAGAHQQATEAAADDSELNLVEDRFASHVLLHVWIFHVAGEFGLHLDILVDAVGTYPPVAFREILVVQCVGVEIEVAGDGGNGRVDLHRSILLGAPRKPGALLRRAFSAPLGLADATTQKDVCAGDTAAIGA